jgi:hypothetical protein
MWTQTRLEIPSSEVWVETGVQLQGGRTYRLAAVGTWTDKQYTCGPEGYPSPNVLLRVMERLRRVPSAPWFALVGTIDRDMKTAFVIGAGCEVTPPRSGELICFANDVRGFYGNNSGAVALFVTRTS